LTKILAIETSSDACSVAISDGELDYSFHELMPKQHTEALIGVIDELLNSASLDIEDIEAVAVGCGPGSFTGIRLACSTAQGISISQNIRGIVVPSLDILASSLNRTQSAEKIVTIINANMDRLYLAEYNYSGRILKNSEIASIPISAFNQKKYDKETFFIGEGCRLVLDSINKVSSQISFELPSALELLQMAKEKHASEDTVTSEQILPLYLTEESNWVKS
tara:strand:- start:1309 stop:1974 length:666 start_codon:yes stop_codon:yes gene_type:complete